MEEELESALLHMAQLLTGRSEKDVAWWLCANHPRWLLDHPNIDLAVIKAKAKKAGPPPTGKNWGQWFERVRALKSGVQ